MVDGKIDLFNSLGIEVEGRRETTYVAFFSSCWLCVFVLPKNEDRLIRPRTFKVIVLMARGETFSLFIPTLASIYRGLNVISRSLNPSYSGTNFPTHYLYGWLAHYFNTNHALDPSTPGPLMVSFSGAQWAMMTIKYLKHNIDKLCSVVESSSSNPKRVSPHDEVKDARRSADGHTSQNEGTDDNVGATSFKRYHLTGAMAEVEGEEKSTSDVESQINYKHQWGRRNKKPVAADLEGKEIDFKNTLDNTPIP
ncbi:Hydroxyacylglutathione hydrolase [Bienertia sinuspersici]